MYFPYLHARGVEKQSIINTICTYSHNKVIPIIDPYDKDEEEIYTNNNLINICTSLVSNQKKFIVIVDQISDLESLSSSVPYFNNFCIYGLLSSDLPNLSKITNYNVAILHDDVSLSNLDATNVIYHIFMPNTSNLLTYVAQYPSQKNVKTENAFASQSQNNAYPVSSVFSDLYSTYTSNGYIGFGDFLTLSDRFKPADGADMTYVTAALHLTYSNGQMLHVKHFTCTPNQKPHISNRIIEVISQAAQQAANFYPSIGFKLLLQKHSTGTATNLATLKRISLEHHIDFIQTLI